MILLFGEKIKAKVLDEGSFECPVCRARQDYIEIQEKGYFTLMFIPTFPTSEHAHYLMCKNCENTFDPDFKQQPAYVSALQMILAFLVNQYGYEQNSIKALEIHQEITSLEWDIESLKSATLTISDWDTLIKRLKLQKKSINYQSKNKVILGAIQMVIQNEEISYDSRVQLNMFASYLEIDPMFVSQTLQKLQ